MQILRIKNPDFFIFNTRLFYDLSAQLTCIATFPASLLLFLSLSLFLSPSDFVSAAFYNAAEMRALPLRVCRARFPTSSSFLWRKIARTICRTRIQYAAISRKCVINRRNMERKKKRRKIESKKSFDAYLDAIALRFFVSLTKLARKHGYNGRQYIAVPLYFSLSFYIYIPLQTNNARIISLFMRLSRGCCLKNSASLSHDEISRDCRLAWFAIISNDAQAREYISIRALLLSRTRFCK